MNTKEYLESIRLNLNNTTGDFFIEEHDTFGKLRNTHYFVQRLLGEGRILYRKIEASSQPSDYSKESFDSLSGYRALLYIDENNEIYTDNFKILKDESIHCLEDNYNESCAILENGLMNALETLPGIESIIIDDDPFMEYIEREALAYAKKGYSFTKNRGKYAARFIHWVLSHPLHVS